MASLFQIVHIYIIIVMSGGGPSPPDHRSTIWNGDAKQLESIVLSTVHMWTLSKTKTEVVTLILRHFVAAEVYEAMCQLALSIEAEKPGSHRNTAERSAGELYAGELHDMMKDLTAKKTLPKVVVTSVALPMVPLATLISKDEVSISARLESLETGMRKLTESVNSVHFGAARPKLTGQGIYTPVPKISVDSCDSVGASGLGGTNAADQGVQGGGLGEHRQANQGEGQGCLEVPREQLGTFADVAARRRAGGGRQDRPRLGSIGEQQKRDRENDSGYQTVQNRRRRPVNHGSSKVEVDEDGQAAPIEVYIGNTTPAATESIVEAVLIKCAKGIEATTDLKVLEVVQLAKQIENPRTKCWKVVVPYKYKELMENDALYPPGWCHRKFFSPRQNRNSAKQPRKDDSIVQVVIDEQRKKSQEIYTPVDSEIKRDEKLTAGDDHGQGGLVTGGEGAGGQRGLAEVGPAVPTQH